MPKDKNAQKFLSFLLDGLEYGVSIESVKEVIGSQKTTPIPEAPDFLIGVIDLRGSTIPIIDLRKRFGLQSATSGHHTCTIIVEHSKAKGQVGLLVDMVSTVLQFHPVDIHPVALMGKSIAHDYVLGVAKHDKNETVLLSIDSLLEEVLPQQDA